MGVSVEVSTPGVHVVAVHVVSGEFVVFIAEAAFLTIV
jgi:hypothetical protein